VTYAASASDTCDANPTVSCEPASGSTFPIGTTFVSCTATDATGNGTSASFPVIVQGAAEQASDLLAAVQSFNLQEGIANSLVAKLQNALDAISAGNEMAGCNQLGAFINEVQAQAGKKVTVEQANQLIAAANQIKAVLGCP
jgi:acyl-CoA reductase-like NAD-dependent aldehyde dehydrogenase